MVFQLKSLSMWVKTIQSSPVQVGSHHVHQFKLALLLDGHHIDEGLVEHSSFGQLGDDLEGLSAAWWWYVDLLGEPDVSILQSKERVVGSHSDLQEGEREEGHGHGVHTFTLRNQGVGHEQRYIHELQGDTASTSGLQERCLHGQSYLVKKQNRGETHNAAIQLKT